MNANSPPRIAVALSGGGSRAIAFHLGCLRALRDAGILDRVTLMSSVSGGSVIAAMYCSHAGDFSSFEAKVRDVLAAGMMRRALKLLVTSAEGIRAAVSFMLSALDGTRVLAMSIVASPLPDTWYRTLCTPLMWRFASRTTVLRKAFGEILEDKSLADLRDDRPRLLIVACELRTKAAFYFSKAQSHCWRYGSLREPNLPLAQAVCASAAYPVFLPSLDERWRFSKDGKTETQHVQLTDGGVYDNLGLSAFWPGRDPSMSLDVPKPDILIICRAGYGLEKQPRSLFLLSRMKAVVESIHARVENLAINRVFNLGQSGEYERVILAYLGQDDRKLKGGGTSEATREQALGYPTNFSAMTEEWIERLAARGKHVMAAVLTEHWPELAKAAHTPS